MAEHQHYTPEEITNPRYAGKSLDQINAERIAEWNVPGWDGWGEVMATPCDWSDIERYETVYREDQTRYPGSEPMS